MKHLIITLIIIALLVAGYSIYRSHAHQGGLGIGIGMRMGSGETGGPTGDGILLGAGNDYAIFDSSSYITIN